MNSNNELVLEEITSDNWIYVNPDELYTDMTLYFHDSNLAVKVHSQYMIVNSEYVKSVYISNDMKVSDVHIKDIFKDLNKDRIELLLKLIYNPLDIQSCDIEFDDLIMVWDIVDYFSFLRIDNNLRKIVQVENSIINYCGQKVNIDYYFKMIYFCQKRKLDEGQDWFRFMIYFLEKFKNSKEIQKEFIETSQKYLSEDKASNILDEYPSYHWSDSVYLKLFLICKINEMTYEDFILFQY